MELEDTEFVRRFSLHILPWGFVRIRHYGILSSTRKTVAIPCIRNQFTEKQVCFIDMRKPQPYIHLRGWTAYLLPVKEGIIQMDIY